MIIKSSDLKVWVDEDISLKVKFVKLSTVTVSGSK